MSTVKAINLQHPTSSNANIVLNSSGQLLANSIEVYANTTGANGGIKVISQYGAGYFGTYNNYPAVLHKNGTDWIPVSVYDTNNSLNQLYTGGVERMRIDGNGYVTKPNQPFFMGYPTTDYSGGSMPTQVMAVTAYFNNGNCFSSATNRFTCPVTGWYRVTWGGLQLPTSVVSLQINGSDVHNGVHCVGSSYITMTQTVLRQQAAGDYFTLRQWNGGGYYSSWWIWSVELVG